MCRGLVNWPVGDDGVYFREHLGQDDSKALYTWLGSLATNGAGGTTGLLYRRNRYYDSETGRWTQEDPIGIAGGINVFGFAAGDPVNHRDPFGLCPPKTYAEVFKCTGQLLTPVQQAGEAVGEFFVEDIERGAAALGRGEHITGVFLIASSLPSPGGGAKWSFGAFKSAARWARQLTQRGWTSETISEAIDAGRRFDAENLVNKGNAASRYVHPTTGRSVVVDDVTKEVLHVGGDGFKYGSRP